MKEEAFKGEVTKRRELQSKRKLSKEESQREENSSRRGSFQMSNHKGARTESPKKLSNE